MSTVIKVENLSKYYRLGLIGGKTLHDDLNRWWARVRKQPDPLLKIGQEDRRNGNDKYLWALRDINFEVQQGEIVGIIGRNGAGKSTLLKILSRITAPTSGQVKVKGRIASLLEVGTGFHPELTGRENIYLNGAILGMKKAEIDRKFDEIVAFAEVEKFIDTPVKRYSSGMYVRLAFAVAAHLEPEILVVDEVLAVGDAAFQKKCLGKMGEVAKEGRTVLFVSHNMESIQQLCKRSILLDGGNILLNGDTHHVVSRYIKQWHHGLKPFYRAPNHKDMTFPDNACLLEAEILNAKGNSCHYLRFQEPFMIRMLWQHLSHISAVSYAIRVYDSSNRFLFAVNTLNADLNIENAGLHEVLCKFNDNVLVPGEYQMSIGCYIRPHTIVHVVNPCMSFSVENIPYDQNDLFNIVGNPIISLFPAWMTK